MNINARLMITSMVIATSVYGSQPESLEKFHIQKESIASLVGPVEDLSIYRNKNGDWHVVENGLETKVESAFVDPLLKAMQEKQLEGFQKNGYIVVKRLTQEQQNDPNYILRAFLRVQGGGPILGMILYGATKAVCYGVGIAAGTAVVGGVAAGAVAATIGTGGAAAPVLAVVGAKIGAIGLGAGASAALGTVGAAGASVVAAGIGGTAGGAALASSAVAGTAVAAGGVAGLIAMIEGAAIGMAAIGTALPTP